ncbi:hypothetical protein JTB14_037855 [Gonioctena quinquepunctata]|nr:hypothetical protein JTB14_037855 [Gonioctena quinquepunctata]
MILALVFISAIYSSESMEISARIFDGTPVTRGKVPYIVSIENENYQICAADIILLNNSDCLQDIQPGCHNFDPEAHLCTGPLDDTGRGVGYCDDGGPLVVDNKLAGIILMDAERKTSQVVTDHQFMPRLVLQNFIDPHLDSHSDSRNAMY